MTKKLFWPKTLFWPILFFWPKKVFWVQAFLTQILPGPNFFKLSIPGGLRIFRAFASLFFFFFMLQMWSIHLCSVCWATLNGIMLIIKFICPNCKIHLSELLNVLYKQIFKWARGYLVFTNFEWSDVEAVRWAVNIRHNNFSNILSPDATIAL